MMEKDGEKQFLDHAKRGLDESAAEMDELTIAKLKAARARALAHDRSKHTWWWPAGSLATVATVALVFWLAAAQSPEMPSGMDDLDILATEESFEFYAEMEFYDWLASSDLAG